MGPTATDRSACRSLLRAFTLAGAGAVWLVGGCSTDLDTYLDPSSPIRAEATPTVVPILDRIASIEGPEESYLEFDSIRTDDLRAEASEYRVGSGDQLEVRVWDIISPGQVEVYPLLVDTRGMVMIPQLGELGVAGLTAEQVRESIARTAEVLVHDPLVQVTVLQSRSQTFTILGAVSAPGAYFIPTADYRLLDALTTAGGIPETVASVLVIRQIPLEPQAINAGPTGGGTEPGGEHQGEDFIRLLDDVTGGGSPGMLGSGQPAVDLVEGDAPSRAGTEPDSAWIFVNGEWVRAGGVAGGDDEATADALFTQRIIKVPSKALLAGDARYNIVVRPSDIIRVPPPDQGFVYLGGEVNQPGAYNLPVTGPYTLRRAILAAGGLGPTGIPERCDLTRMVGESRQATIMLNYRAIVEGTQPDVVLKANDIIEVGTTFWAYPLAVFRNGFRASYGFGFLLDRNFGNDVFGAPPTNLQDR